jgi:hypothetical protein
LTILQAAVTGLAPSSTYLVALSVDPNGAGTLEPLATFVTNPAGAAVVDTVGPIRRVVQATRRGRVVIWVIAPVTDGKIGAPVQVQR